MYEFPCGTRGKKFLKEIHFKLGMDLSKGQKQGKDEKTQEHYPTRNDGGRLSGLQCNALASLVHFVVCTVN